MQSLINDPAVAKYRELEIAEAAKIVKEMESKNLDFVNGAMYLLRKLLHLPYTWGTSKESKEAAQMMVKRDVKTFTTKYMKLFIE